MSPNNARRIGDVLRAFETGRLNQEDTPEADDLGGPTSHFVGKASGAITAFSGTTPGTGNVEIYQVNDDGTLADLGRVEPGLNLGTAIADGAWLVLHREAETGQLFVTPVGGAGSVIVKILPTGVALGGGITGVTGLVLITTATAHGFSVGDSVTIASVIGATEANGTFVIQTVPSATTFTIPLASVSTYSSQGTATDGTATANITGVAGTTGSRVTTATAHGLYLGDAVTIAAVGGATGINGTRLVTGVASTTTFAIGNSPGGAYTSGGTVVRAARTVGSGFFYYTCLIQTHAFNSGGFSNGSVAWFLPANQEVPAIGGRYAGVPVANDPNGRVVYSENLSTVKVVFITSTNDTGTITNVGTGAFPTITTAADHGLAVGDIVTIANVLGTVLANGQFTVTSVPTSATFTIPISDPGTYISGGSATYHKNPGYSTCYVQSWSGSAWVNGDSALFMATDGVVDFQARYLATLLYTDPATGLGVYAGRATTLNPDAAMHARGYMSTGPQSFNGDKTLFGNFVAYTVDGVGGTSSFGPWSFRANRLSFGAIPTNYGLTFGAHTATLQVTSSSPLSPTNTQVVAGLTVGQLPAFVGSFLTVFDISCSDAGTPLAFSVNGNTGVSGTMSDGSQVIGGIITRIGP